MNNNIKKDCYVISIDYPESKIKYLENYNLNPIWFNGVNGEKIKKWEKLEYVSKEFEKYGTNGMIGCAISHIKLWEYILSNDLDYAIVFEDDIVLTINFDEYLGKALINVPEDFDILYLGGFGGNNDSNFTYRTFCLSKKECPSYKNINEYISKPSVVTGLHGYIISKKGAEVLLKMTKGKVNDHIDVYINNLYKNGLLNNYIVNPRIAFQTSTDNINSLNVSGKHPYIINKLLSNIEVDRMQRLNYIVSLDLYKIGPFVFNQTTHLFFIIGILLCFLLKKDFIRNMTIIFLFISIPDLYLVLKTKNIKKRKKYILQILLHYIVLVIPLLIILNTTNLIN